MVVEVFVYTNSREEIDNYEINEENDGDIDSRFFSWVNCRISNGC